LGLDLRRLNLTFGDYNGSRGKAALRLLLATAYLHSFMKAFGLNRFRGKPRATALPVCQGNCGGADTAGKINPVAVQALNRSVERRSKQNWSIPFNTHKAIALPNRPGLVQSIFSPPARRSALVFSRKNLAPRRRAKNALQNVLENILLGKTHRTEF